MIRKLIRGLLVGLGVRWMLLKVGEVLYPSARPRVMQTRIMGFDLLVLVNEDVGRRMVFVRRYETRDAEYLAAQIRPGDICLDVGANTGYYAMLMGRAAMEGKVHAFEPVRINWHLLGGGIALNRFANVIANNSAVGAKQGEMEFSQSADGAYSSLVAVGRRPELRQIRVTVDTIDAYADRHSLSRIDVMKVDVEGAEVLVLEGATALLKSELRRPRIVMLELSSVNLAAYQSSIDAIVATMRGFGYLSYVVLSDGKVAPYTAEHHDLYYNVFFQTESVASDPTECAK